MRYLGSVTLAGALSQNGEDAAAASFELECYAVKGGLLHGSGEVTASPKSMRAFLGLGDVDFVTEDGHTLKLKLADKKTPPQGGSALVVASGDLPIIQNGSAEWTSSASAAVR